MNFRQIVQLTEYFLERSLLIRSNVLNDTVYKTKPLNVCILFYKEFTELYVYDKVQYPALSVKNQIAKEEKHYSNYISSVHGTILYRNITIITEMIKYKYGDAVNDIKYVYRSNEFYESIEAEPFRFKYFNISSDNTGLEKKQRISNYKFLTKSCVDK